MVCHLCLFLRVDQYVRLFVSGIFTRLDLIGLARCRIILHLATVECLLLHVEFFYDSL